MEITAFIVKICIIFNAIRMIATGPLQRWTYELLEINSNTSDPDIFDIKAEVVRLGRWQYGFSAFVAIRADLYDNVTIRGTVERSKYRDGPYSMFPMGIENQTISKAINVYYKRFIQPDSDKCCDNAPHLTDKFKAPLTKRYVTCTNCTLSTDNAPNILMEGYYRMRCYMSGPADVFGEALSLIETKIV